MSRIVVLYNTDYDAEQAEHTGLDVTSVRESAKAIAGALIEVGHTVELAGVHGVEVYTALQQIRAARPDLLFNLCESMDNNSLNEPTFAGLLDLFSIPYTGADLVTLAVCLHKQRTKDILLANHIPTPPYRFLRTVADLDDPASAAALETLDYPWFVKLAHEDASLGITEANVVADGTALRTRSRELITQYHQPVIAERYVEGREINVTLLGNGRDLRTLPLHEIDFAAMPSDRPRIVSYAAKWEEGHVDYAGTKPVPMAAASPELVQAIEQVAIDAYRAIELRDYGRVDLRVDAAGVPWVIDVNPNPDISPDSGVTRAAAAAGLAYPQLVGTIASIALKRISG
jgi:D-alanine-D-alanine ligase